MDQSVLFSFSMELTLPLPLASVVFDSTDKSANTLRAPSAPAAQGEAPPTDGLDHSDAEVWALEKGDA